MRIRQTATAFLRRRLALVFAVATLPSSGCFTAAYLGQAAGGQYEILHGAQILRAAVRDGRIPERTRGLLMLVPAIKDFGRANGLKPTRNYEHYVDLHRPAAVWVVQACAPLAFDVRRWRFPLVGSVPYLGYFDEGAARRKAQALKEKEGLDVDVRTASAYSTLGYLRDPVLSTMVSSGEDAVGDLANVILHESVHATLYFPGQSTFDESLASFVADRLTLEYLRRSYGAEAAQTRAWAAEQRRSDEHLFRLRRAYAELDRLYRSAEADDVKRARKTALLGELQRELHLRRPLNNASLAGYRTYDSGAAELERLFAACQESWPRFFAALGALSAADFDRPQQESFGPVIDRLAARGCPPVSRYGSSPVTGGSAPPSRPISTYRR
jgi:predicted aminopeptidase